nr:hypothetical protein [uncultured Desulfobacter sp.]
MKYRVVLSNAVTFILVAALVLGADFIIPNSVLAGPPMRGKARMSIHGGGHHGGGHGGGGHNTNINVNVNHHGGGGHHDDHRHHHHDVIGGVVAGAITGLAIGAIVTAASMPSGCTDVVIGGIAYRQCGSTWYQPYYQGTTVQYIVVNPPR